MIVEYINFYVFKLSYMGGLFCLLALKKEACFYRLCFDLLTIIGLQHLCSLRYSLTYMKSRVASENEILQR
jgi:hypothetical protein